ncbi:hypothetical protein ABT115_06185 [Streptomyces sp. NPDC001832]|uniref:hypothetical protein n=1 Tax=Streptomyces sp. NPDC001832 TaxID=3154527 RepID=UPI003323EEF5
MATPSSLSATAPARLHPQELTHLGTEQRADHREEITAAVPGIDAGDGVPVLLVGVGDALQHTYEDGHVGHAPTDTGRVRHPHRTYDTP